MVEKKWRVAIQSDLNGRYRLWTIPDGPHNLPTPEDLWAEAEKYVPDFATREFDISAETLTPGALHLVEKGFNNPPGSELRRRDFPGGVTR